MRDPSRLVLKFSILFSMVLASLRVCYAGTNVSISGALEPAFYSTGDYKSFVRSLFLQYWPTKYLGFSASTGKFDFLQDRLTWYTSVQVKVFGLEALFKTAEWYRQHLEFGVGYSRLHRRSDVTFLEFATKDSSMIQRIQMAYMNSPHDSLGTEYTNFRMRTAIRDENGFYRHGISRLRDYSLNGISAHLTYSVRLIGDIQAQISPKVRYYQSEPLYIWSVSCGLNIPLFSIR